MDPPPPYSAAPETEGARATRAQPLMRWHPKITPCRLFVLLTIIILGTVKAAFAYRGQSKISTTLEWIAGTVFTLLVFVLGEWESHESYPKHLEWFFASDCANLIWRAIRVPRPLYHSDESSAGPTSEVAVTGYRILVSVTVVILGIVKAILSYLGHNTTANTFDWTLGVLATSCFYCIGLYELNSANLAPTFFTQDHSSMFFRNIRSVSTILALGLGTYGCIKWFTFSLFLFSTIRNIGETVSTTAGLFVLLQSLNVYILCVSAIFLACSLLGIVTVLVLSFWALQQELPRIVSFVFQPNTSDRLIFWSSSVAEKLKLLLRQPLHYVHRIGYTILRMVAHLFAIVVVAALFFLFAGIVMILGNPLEIRKGITGKLAGGIITQCVLALYAIALLWILYYLLRSLIKPFRLSSRSIV